VATRPLTGGAYQAPDKVNPAIGQMRTATLIGMSEPDRIAWLRTNLWPYIGRLLAACADGIRSVDRSARFSTHISGIFENTAAVPLAFWEEMGVRGYRADLLGTSYYASAGAIGGSGDRVQWLKQTAAALQQRFHKRLFISETGYPSGKMSPPYPYNTPVAGYPLTSAGQNAFIRDIVAWGASSGRLAGIRPWAPDLCTAGSNWEPMSFFTSSRRLARAKPALAAISQGLSRC
jgi:arabinogalactan endo-1,4-beta-galactosidase